jgi:hypothetical protein
VVLRKPSEYFKKDIATVNTSVQETVRAPELNTFSDAFEAFKSNLSKIEVLSEFSDTLDNYRVNIERVNHLSEKVGDIQTEIQTLLKKEDLNRAMMSQLLVVEQSIRDVQNKVKGINENKLTEIRLDVSGLTQSVNEFLEVEVPQYKKLIVDSEIRTNNRYQELEENVNQTLEGIVEFVDNKYQELTETLQGINDQSLVGIFEDFKVLGNIVQEFKEKDIPKYKGFIVETERKTESKLEEFNSTTENKLNEFQEKLNETVSGILEKVDSIGVDNTDFIDTINQKIQEVNTLSRQVKLTEQSTKDYKNEIKKKVSDLESDILRNETHIRVQNKNLKAIQEEVKETLGKINLQELESQNHKLGKKIKYLEEVFENFSEKEILTENILVEPPSTDNKDPLTPLDQNFVTLDQLQQHYRLFINRIQQQLATIGGGGETRLEFLDDVDRNSAKVDGRFLKYDAASGKWIGAVGGGGGSQTLDDTLGLGNTSSLGMSVGVITATYFVGDGSLLTNISSSSNSGYATSAGIATYATSAGISTQTTRLQNSRTFEITGDIIASPISFDGTGNVSLAATIQPNSVSLGSDTTGDYVSTITGTSNQITVTSGTGEGSTPILSIPSQFTAPQDVTVTRDLQVNRNLNVNGNITIGGTSVTLFTTEFKVYDPDIVLGFRTDGSGNDISTDNTANHGGIAIASTEGTPLISLYDVGVGETNPATYKKFMWFKAGTFSGLGTDAWLSNYAVGIGSTQFPTGTRLAAGSVQFTENDLAVVRNINASGVVTASSFSGNASSATYATSAGIATYASSSGISTYATSAGIATYASSSGISTYATSAGIATYASSSGIATVAQGLTGNPNINVGIITATSYNGSGINLTGIVTSITAGSGISVDQSTGNVTITATGGGGGSSLGIATAGGTVGTGVTLLDFRGSGISTVTVSSGIATINIEGGGGTSTPDISPVMMGMIF